VLTLKSTIETVYFLENPEKKVTKFATGTQLLYEDTIKDVFGVASINDLNMMIRYNKGFQDSICLTHGITESNITLDRILRVASKLDLLLLRKQIVAERAEEVAIESDDNALSIPCPFDSTIKLREGVFKWDDSNSSYHLV
jgi:hypothetical protein